MTARRHFRRTRAAARSGVLSGVCFWGTLSVSTACGRVGYDLLDPLTEGPSSDIVATLGGPSGTPSGNSTLGSDPITSSGPTSPTSNGPTPTNSSGGPGDSGGAPAGTGGATSEAGAAGIGGTFAEQGGTNGSSETGGTANGGTANGGTANGGTANGGTANGGAANSGTANGGTASAGMANGGGGGTASGGMANGGTASGGAANGGAANGGMANGGAASGGMANGGTASGGGGATSGAGGSSGAGGGTAEGGSGGVASPCVETEGGAEQCDGVDNDCSGTIDDGSACSAGCSGSVFSGESYMFCSTALDPVAAAAACSAENMRLARINDSAENDYIDQLLAPEAWIGGSDSSEGLWLWPDGSVFWTDGAAPAGVYTHFDVNQPDENGGVSNEDCLVMRVTGFWNDKPCTISLPFLCERY